MDKILSIIVPSYNMEAYLPKCLGSLVIDDKELLRKLDVIVVNDGSQDRTGAIAHEFEERFPGVFRVIDKANGHYGSCINAALPAVAGEFVKVLDADDSFSTSGFQSFVRFLYDRAGDADLVVSDYDVVDEGGGVQAHFAYGFPVDEAFPLERLVATCGCLMMYSFAYRTSIFHSVPYRQLEGFPYTDGEWSLLPLAGVSLVRYCPATVYRYLLGRAGQTVEEAQMAKNYWMLGEVALDIVSQFMTLRAKLGAETRLVLQKAIVRHLAHFYRGGIISGERPPKNIDLADFDLRLSKVSEELYRSVEEEPYSRHLPYRFIRGWRLHSPFFPIMRKACLAYSLFAKRYARRRRGVRK